MLNEVKHLLLLFPVSCLQTGGDESRFFVAALLRMTRARSRDRIGGANAGKFAQPAKTLNYSISKNTNFRTLRTTMLENFRGLRKFCKRRRLSDRIFRAPSPKTPSFRNFFGFLLRAFASLREIFRFLVAALPHWDLPGENEFFDCLTKEHSA
jgi:hypothetical protein